VYAAVSQRIVINVYLLVHAMNFTNVNLS
jgi:hypothetical protein